MEGMERLNGVLSKTIELAEAALQLGVRLVDNMGRGGEGSRSRPADSAAPHGYGEDAQEGPPAQQGPVPSDGRVGNRTPLRPGSEVRIAFSISNDASAKRAIALKLGPLVGEARGASLAEGALSVSPDRFTLEPFDFEKLVLVGRIPANTPPDAYAGGIVVTGADQPIVVPLRLVVT
jgi:hypothetical protein